MNRVVLKFGGSSLATLDLMKKVAQKIVDMKESYEEIIVVASAMGKTTSELIHLAKAVSKYPNKREVDLLVSTGEMVSSSLLSMILQDLGFKAIALTGFQAGIHTKGIHTKNKISDIDTSHIEKQLKEGYIVVITGFQGLNNEGEITTLGRGGSDTTAIALAAKLNCHAEIYTDVDGIYGVDPKLFPQAQKLREIDYEEMKEMSFLGAKVMEPRSIDIAQTYGVKVYVASAHQALEGTYIKEKKSKMEEKKVTGIAISDKVIMVSIRKIPYQSQTTAALFNELAQNEINVDVINQNPSIRGQMNIAFTAHVDDLDAIYEVIDNFKKLYPTAVIEMATDLVKVSLVGSAMRTQSGIAAEAFNLLASHHLEFRLVTTSEISISYTFDRKYKSNVVELFAQHFKV